MKNLIALATLAIVTPACVEMSADDDPTLTTTESALTTRWTAYTSEEYAPITCPIDGLVQGARCSGRYCDNIALRCEVPVAAWVDVSFWRPYISEESPNTMICDSGEWMIGARCRGRYCDDISIQCQRIDAPPFHSGQGYNCEWTPWISEEQSAGYSWTIGKYARGMQCSGSYCDNQRFLVCNI